MAKQMKEVIITSSFIQGAAYNEQKECLRLTIGNYWYYYFGITRQRVARFKNAVSCGSYYGAKIKGKFKVIRRKVR